MYAVVKTGGKQYRVQPGDVLRFEKLEGDVGKAVQFNEVLFFSSSTPSELNINAEKASSDEQTQIWLGKPFVENATVAGEIISQGRGEKVLIQKYKRRKQYRRFAGHRQEYTEVLITGLDNGAGGKQALSSAEKKEKASKFFSLLVPKGGKPQKPAKTKAKKTEAKAEEKEAKKS